MNNIIDSINACDRCLELGISYQTERIENIDFAYSYKPNSVKYLWIIESPPHSKPPRYFYRPELTKHDGLYREIMKALNIIPSNPKSKGLTEFQERSNFLIDAAKCPIDKGNRPLSTQMLFNCRSLLQSEVISINPQNIIIIKSSTFLHVKDCMREIGYDSRIINSDAIPFPGSGQQVKFKTAVRKLLNIVQSDFRRANDNRIQRYGPNKRQEYEKSEDIQIVDSVIIDNITEKDAQGKIIRILAGNKFLFPREIIGQPIKHDLIINYYNIKYNVTYTIGSHDENERSGVLRIGSELYAKLKIRRGIRIQISKDTYGEYHIVRQ